MSAFRKFSRGPAPASSSSIFQWPLAIRTRLQAGQKPEGQRVAAEDLPGFHRRGEKARHGAAHALGDKRHAAGDECEHAQDSQLAQVVFTCITMAMVSVALGLLVSGLATTPFIAFALFWRGCKADSTPLSS